jgi:hypothetical protein
LRTSSISSLSGMAHGVWSAGTFSGNRHDGNH